MLRRASAFFIVLTMLTTLIAWPQPEPARAAASCEEVPPTFPPPQVQYFSETGHAAVNYFLESWQNTPNALFVYGYPISRPFLEESFTNPGECYRVQYFERAVLEEHPENAGTEFYVLGRLMGSKLAEGREGEAPFQRVGDPGDGTWFESTGHTLRNDPAPFRTFWEQNGALEVFGYPISEQFQEVNQADGQTYWVQYFERQRMEWHPEQPDPQFQILLGLLGNEAREANHSNNPAFNPGGADDSLPRPFVYGYNAHLYQDASAWQDRSRVLEMSKNSGIYWLRQQIAWEDIQDQSGAIYWAELDDIVADAHNAGVNLLISVVRSPSWATPDGGNGMPAREHFGTYANFMGAMAERYRGRVQAYQVWNEPNLAVENAGRVASANYYVDMLAAAHDAIKAADPYAIVVSGSPSATETDDPFEAISDITFIRQMLQNPNFRADVIGTHPGGQNNPPDSRRAGDPGNDPGWDNSGEFYFRRIEEVRQVMLETGYGDRQIWLTEFGWATQNNTPGYEYGADNTLDEQAQYIVRAFQIGRREWAPWMGGMFLWNLNFSVPWAQLEGNPLHEQASFSVINGDWSPRPAWYAVQAMPKD
jgi:hypothetical protein